MKRLLGIPPYHNRLLHIIIILLFPYYLLMESKLYDFIKKLHLISPTKIESKLDDYFGEEKEIEPLTEEQLLETYNTHLDTVNTYYVPELTFERFKKYNPHLLKRRSIKDKWEYSRKVTLIFYTLLTYLLIIRFYTYEKYFTGIHNDSGWHGNTKKIYLYGKKIQEIHTFNNGGETLKYWVNGLPHGTWWSTDGDGKYRFIEFWKDGRLDGISQSWYRNGQREYIRHYKDGVKVGLWRYWYENGQKLHEKTYKDGKGDGVWTHWHENGQKMSESNNKDGENNSYKEWNEDGSVLEFEDKMKMLSSSEKQKTPRLWGAFLKRILQKIGS